nr:12483_t:CDS:1 [Entrophospora candida]
MQYLLMKNNKTSNETEVSNIESIETQNNGSNYNDLENKNNNILNIENNSTEFGSDNLYFKKLASGKCKQKFTD